MTIPPNTTTKPCLADQIIAEHKAEYARFRADLAEKAALVAYLIGVAVLAFFLMWLVAP